MLLFVFYTEVSNVKLLNIFKHKYIYSVCVDTHTERMRIN